MTANASPIFIIGSGRSGTTLLRMMLNAHPNIYISNEASYYLINKPIMQKHRAAGVWLDLFTQTANFTWLRLDEKRVRERIPETLPESQFGQVFDTLMQMTAERYDKPRYGDKTPGYCVKLERIFADFPQAKVVHIIRDPRPTIASMCYMPWVSGNYYWNARYCARQADAVVPFKNRVHEIRLEDLLNDTERVMREVLAFVEEPWSDQVLHHTAHAPLDDMPPFPWFTDAARKPGSTKKLTKPWRELFSPTQIRAIESVNAPTMQRFGYEPAQLTREPGALALAWEKQRQKPRAFIEQLNIARILLKYGQGKMRRAAQMTWSNPDAWVYYPDFDINTVSEWELADIR